MRLCCASRVAWAFLVVSFCAFCLQWWCNCHPLPVDVSFCGSAGLLRRAASAQGLWPCADIHCSSLTKQGRFMHSWWSGTLKP